MEKIMLSLKAMVLIAVLIELASSVDPRTYGIIEFSSDPEIEKQLLANQPGKPRVELETCMLGGKIYQVGEKWHPELEPFGKMNCTTCHCKQSSKISCWRESCRRLNCRHPKRIPGKCCPVCPDRKGGKPRKNNRRKRPLTALSVGRSCTHNGRVYYDGQSFVNQEQTTSSVVTSSSVDQCAQCVCVDGKTLCRMKTCRLKIDSSCMTVTQGDGDCCPMCADCNYLGETYTNGTTWHPVVESVGEMPCITCGCLNGEVACRRQICPLDDKLKCSRPVLKLGDCCKTCPSTDNTPDITEVEVTSKDREFLDPELFDSGLEQEEKRGEREAEDPFILLEQTVATPIGDSVPCLPRGADTFVHYWQNRTTVLLIFQYKISATVYNWKYTRNKGKILSAMHKTCITIPELQSLLLRHQGTRLIGATTVGRVERYRRRVAKWYRRCGDNCRLRSLRRKEKSLKLTNVLYGPECSNNSKLHRNDAKSNDSRAR